jgi:hypothetical protein
MPETYGKRQRRDARARKIAAREERRAARTQRRDMRAAGLLPQTDDVDETGTPEWLGEPPSIDP